MFSVFGNMRVALRAWIAAHPFTAVGGAAVFGYFMQYLLPVVLGKMLSML